MIKRNNLNLEWYPYDFVAKLKIKDTPLVIINLDRIKSSFRILKNHLKDRIEKFSIYYALKASYLKPVIETLKKEGIDGLEIISPLEMKIALKAGFNKNQLIYNGLFRNKEDLLNLIHKGSIVNIDSLFELENLTNQQNLSIGLRIHPFFRDDGNFIKRGSKLGLDENSFEKALVILKKNNIKLKGVHLHLFSNMRNPTSLKLAIKRVLNIILDAEKYLGYKLDYLDIGGGLSPL